MVKHKRFDFGTPLTYCMDQQMVLRIGYYDEEEGETGTETQRGTVQEFLDRFEDRYPDFQDDYGYTWENRHRSEPELIRTAAELRAEWEERHKWSLPFDLLITLDQLTEKICNDTSDGPQWVISFLPEYEDDVIQREEWRRKLEKRASEVAKKHGVTVNSMAFIEAVSAELHALVEREEQYDSHESRMEEWGRHREAGVSTEVYYDNRNYTHGQFEKAMEDLEDILEYISEQCPLLWAQYQESKLEKPESEDEDAC